MTMPFIYVFVSQLLTVIHGRISRRGRARSAGEMEVGDAAGERERQAMTRIFSFSPPEASGESETEFPALQNACRQ